MSFTHFEKFPFTKKALIQNVSPFSVYRRILSPRCFLNVSKEAFLRFNHMHDETLLIPVIRCLQNHKPLDSEYFVLIEISSEFLWCRCQTTSVDDYR